MTKLSIVEWPSKILETNSIDVVTFDDELRQFIADMFETMESASGIGLAANQVGQAKKIVTIHIPFENNRYEKKGKAEKDHDNEEGRESQEPAKLEIWHNRKFTLINPVIVKKKGNFSWQEGCLSFPEIFENIKRSKEVWVNAKDEFGTDIEIHGTGLFSVCLQHEIDHINGVVFLNRMSRLKSGLVKKKILKKDRKNYDYEGEDSWLEN